MYRICFDFEGEDPPNVMVVDAGGMTVAQVYEEPTSALAEHSWEAEDWKPGPLALRMVALLNAGEGAPAG